MSFYNMIFGKNPSSELVLALLDLKGYEVERFRDCGIDHDAREISIYTRTGGGNREGYPNTKLEGHPCYVRGEDDEYDCTYRTFYFRFPPDIADDIAKLADINANGIPAPIIRKACEVSTRKTDADAEQARYEAACAEVRAVIQSGGALVYNGHTLAPMSDHAFRRIARAAEAFDGEPPGYYAICALKPCDTRDKSGWDRLSTIKWVVDSEWRDHWAEVFRSEFPKTVAEMIKTCSRVRP